MPVWRPLEQSPVNSSDSQTANNGPGGEKTVRTVDSPWVERLLMLHRQVRSAVAKADLT